jgi:hypothetical protein
MIVGIYLMNYACANDMQCYSMIKEVGFQSEIAKVTGFLYGDSLALLLLAIYWEYRISIFGKFIGYMKESLKSKPLLTLPYELLLEEEPVYIGDESVQLERKIAHAPPILPNCPLLIRDLSKKYKEKQALDKLCLRIQEGGIQSLTIKISYFSKNVSLY